MYLDQRLGCCKGCCSLQFSSFTCNPKKHRSRVMGVIKSAGVAVICNGSIMLTQSYNNYWGIPKGKMEPYETLEQCALRELNEESGMVLPIDIFNHTKVHTYVPPYDNNLTIHIFIYVMDKPCELNDNLMDDSTGRGWIKLSCLHNLQKSHKIKLNKLTRYMLKYKLYKYYR